MDLRARLTDQPDQQLFTVDAPTRLYWRIAALDRFDGTVWGIESQAEDVGRALGRRRPAGTVRQEFTITALDDQWLPAAYRPEATDLTDARVVADSGTLVASNQQITGLTYRVDSRVAAHPTAAEVRATAARLPARLASLTDLPSSFPASVVRRARRIVAGAPTPYAEAQRLQDFFLDGSFTYDLNGPEGTSSSAILNFLRSRRGFCQQFAGAYAAMAARGRPARARRGRVHTRDLRHHPRCLRGPGPRRPRVARGLARGAGLDAIRTDASRRGPGPVRQHRRATRGRALDDADLADDRGTVRADDRAVAAREPDPAR